MRIRIDMGKVLPFRELPDNTLALDGACPGVHLDLARQRFSFDHHDSTARLASAATCRQVHDALLLGFDPSRLTVRVNHLDGDVVLSLWMLHDPARWNDAAGRKRLGPLVDAVASADSHGPSYPLADPELYRGFRASVTEPCRRLLDADARPRLALQAAWNGLDAWWREGAFPFDQPVREPMRFRVRSHGTWVFLAANPAGVPLGNGGVEPLRFVLAKPAQEGLHKYTLARRSDLVDGFPIPRLVAELNRAEMRIRGKRLSPGSRWGGSTTIAGSPRDGSRLAPEDVESLIDRVLKRHADGRPARARDVQGSRTQPSAGEA